jgi:hypothetical protein
MTEVTMRGVVRSWKFQGKERAFGEVCLPYGQAVQAFVPETYNALTGRGEQRSQFPAHVKSLARAMEEGSYVPTPVAVALRPHHRKAVVFEDNTFVLTVSSDRPLALTDGGHRLAAIGLLLDKVRGSTDGVDEKQARAAEKAADEIMALPIHATIYFDGDPKDDFLKLQMGKAVDSSHLLSLRIQQKAFDDPAYRLAFEVARSLTKTAGSPFMGLVRFDSKGMAPLPISTLCAKGRSDLATSLIGLARVAPNREADDLAGLITAVAMALEEGCPDIVDNGKVLALPKNGGTKGAATMLIGVSVCMAYLLRDRESLLLTDEDKERLVKAAESLDRPVAGNFSGPVKRGLMAEFAQELLWEDDMAKHQGVPVPLLESLSYSAFGLKK